MARSKTHTARRTPVRSALRDESALRAHVRDGLGALPNTDAIHQDIRPTFGDSLDLDGALQASHPNDHRWDYLLGHTPSGRVVGLETHSAEPGEVSAIVSKKEAAQAQLREHLRDGASVARWYWVASRNVHIPDLDRERRRLDQAGIELVGRQLLAKHLPGAEPAR